MKSILLICSSSQNIYNFRIPLIEQLKEVGYQVYTLAFDSKFADNLKQKKINLETVDDDNRNVNPFSAILLKNKYFRIIRKINPDIVFTFMAKPNVFGVMSAKKANVKSIFSMVEGAGDPFYYKTIKWRLIKSIECYLYRKAFKHSKKVFFLNNDDKNEFSNLKLVREEQSELISGVGVDLDYFSFKPIKEKACFLMASRLLKTKGVMEYCECARRVKQVFPDAVFNLIGFEGDIKVSDIKEYISEGSINYLGFVKDVRERLEHTTVCILPSFYREGLPMSIMEAEAVGRPVITTDNVGCRDAVVDGYNGFLVKQKSIDALVEKCIYFIDNFDKVVDMGINARKYAEIKFNCKLINKKIIGIIESNYDVVDFK